MKPDQLEDLIEQLPPSGVAIVLKTLARRFPAHGRGTGPDGAIVAGLTAPHLSKDEGQALYHLVVFITRLIK